MNGCNLSHWQFGITQCISETVKNVEIGWNARLDHAQDMLCFHNWALFYSLLSIPTVSTKRDSGPVSTLPVDFILKDWPPWKVWHVYFSPSRYYQFVLCCQSVGLNLLRNWKSPFSLAIWMSTFALLYWVFSTQTWAREKLNGTGNERSICTATTESRVTVDETNIKTWAEQTMGCSQ